MTLNSDLTGRVAVVTGASSGMGEATARRLAADGAAVALIARRGEKLEAIASEIRDAGGTALAVTADVTDVTSINVAAATVKDRLGRVGILFNNAGIMLPGPMMEHRDDTQWAQQIDLNVSAAVNVIGAFLDQLVDTAEAGQPADIITTGSAGGEGIFPNFAVYSGTKAFVKHFTATLRAELGPKKVRVSSMSPGVVRTELPNHVTDQGSIDWIANNLETMRVLDPEDIAEVIAFTVSLPKHVNLGHVTVMPTEQSG